VFCLFQAASFALYQSNWSSNEQTSGCFPIDDVTDQLSFDTTRKELCVMFTVKNAENKHVQFVNSVQNVSCNSNVGCMKKGREVYFYQTLN
jgi:hypothetical protein